MEFLRILALNNNHLSGPLPSSLGLAGSLQFIFMQYNFLSSTLPSELGLLSQLELPVLRANSFTGPIPSSFGQLTALTDLDLILNYLTGQIPSSLGNLSSIRTFYLQYNSLSGTIPSSLGQLNQSEIINLSLNFIQGGIPTTFGNFRYLNGFGLAQNFLSGPIPKEFSSLSSLFSIDLSQNFLTSGSASHAFEFLKPNSLKFLSILDISNNKFSGSLPPSLFDIASLSIFIATSNCFTGTLPTKICQAKNLTNLLLDGLSTASGCPPTPLPSLFANLGLVFGTIPQCLFSLPVLQDLYLDGNYFTGSLSAVETLSPSLQNISLSNNQLTGTLPQAILSSSHLVRLDLSYNRLGGLIPSLACPAPCNSPNTNYSRYLQVNRFSGPIPPSLYDAQFVGLLDGNLFGENCDLAPLHDPYLQSFLCGSYFLDTILSVGFGSYFLIILISCILVYTFRFHSSRLFESARTITQTFQSLLERFRSEEFQTKLLIHFPATHLFLTSISRDLFRFGVGTGLSLLFMGVYSLLSIHYSTTTYTYAWFLGAGYLSGLLPTVLLGTLWSFLLATIWFVLRTHQQTYYYPLSPVTPESPTKSPTPRFGLNRNNIFYLLSLLLINLFVVGYINYLFVQSLQFSKFLSLTAKFLMAMFKLIWNNFFLPSLIETKSKFDWWILMIVFNILILPCMAIALTSSACFNSFFHQTPPIFSQFTLVFCAQASPTTSSCEAYSSLSASNVYYPPGGYRFQCSSSLLTSYVDVFLLMTLSMGLLLPLSQVIFLIVLDRSPNFLGFLSRVFQQSFFDLQKIEARIATQFFVFMTFGLAYPVLGLLLCISLFFNLFWLKIFFAWILNQVLMESPRPSPNTDESSPETPKKNVLSSPPPLPPLSVPSMDQNLLLLPSSSWKILLEQFESDCQNRFKQIKTSSFRPPIYSSSPVLSLDIPLTTQPINNSQPPLNLRSSLPFRSSTTSQTDRSFSRSRTTPSVDLSNAISRYSSFIFSSSSPQPTILSFSCDFFSDHTQLCLCLSGCFCSLFLFDMAADIRASFLDGLVALVPMSLFVPLCLLFIGDLCLLTFLPTHTTDELPIQPTDTDQNPCPSLSSSPPSFRMRKSLIEMKINTLNVTSDE